MTAVVLGRLGQRFDMDAARDAVIARDPRCAPNFWMEDVVLPEIAKELSARDAA